MTRQRRPDDRPADQDNADLASPPRVQFSVRHVLTGITVFCVLMAGAGVVVLWIAGLIGTGLFVLGLLVIPQAVLLLALKPILENLNKR